MISNAEQAHATIDALWGGPQRLMFALDAEAKLALIVQMTVVGEQNLLGVEDALELRRGRVMVERVINLPSGLLE